MYGIQVDLVSWMEFYNALDRSAGAAAVASLFSHLGRQLGCTSTTQKTTSAFSVSPGRSPISSQFRTQECLSPNVKLQMHRSNLHSSLHISPHGQYISTSREEPQSPSLEVSQGPSSPNWMQTMPFRYDELQSHQLHPMY